MSPERRRFHLRMRRFEERLPPTIARGSRRVRFSSRWIRIPLAAVLIAGGFLGFLPVLGFWMVPLGLLLLAIDVPFLRAPMERLLHWIETRWPRKAR